MKIVLAALVMAALTGCGTIRRWAAYQVDEVVSEVLKRQVERNFGDMAASKWREGTLGGLFLYLIGEQVARLRRRRRLAKEKAGKKPNGSAREGEQV